MGDGGLFYAAATATIGGIGVGGRVIYLFVCRWRSSNCRLGLGYRLRGV